MNNQKAAAPFSSRIYSNATASSIGSGFGTSTTGGNSDYVTVVADVNDSAMGSIGLLLITSFGASSSNKETAPVVNNRDGSKSITVLRGSTVRVSASAATGYVLDKFTGTPTPPATNTARFDVVVNQDCVFHAQFRKVSTPTKYKVHVDWNRSMGTVRCSDTLDANGDVLVNNGCSITLTASASQGYHFLRWDGCSVAGQEGRHSKTSNPITEQIFGERTITAVFEADTPGGGGGETPPGGGGGETPPGGGGGETPGGGGGIETPTTESTGFSLKSFVKKWWWAILIVAYIVIKDREGGSK